MTAFNNSMLDVSFEMGKMAFGTGLDCEPKEDVFYVEYIANILRSPDISHVSDDEITKEGHHWRAGWYVAQQDLGERLSRPKNSI